MKSTSSLPENYLMLVSTLEISDLMEIVANNILGKTLAPSATAILIWDPDLEIYCDIKLFGPAQKDFAEFAQAFAEHNPPFFNAGATIQEFGLLDVSQWIITEFPANLSPVYYYNVAKDNKLSACILIAGAGRSDIQAIENVLNQYPLQLSFSNCFEIRELKRENKRLRNLYEDLEDQNRVLEEQTRKLIHDTMAKDTLRTKHIEREKLLYEISNAARSSLQIQEVLENAINKIGQRFGLSRCTLLRRGSVELAVYEYNQDTVASAKELFLSEMGASFVRTALSNTIPHDFQDPSLDTQNTFSKDFLISLNLKSGLLIPLIMRERNIGAIFLQDCLAPREWSIDDIAFFGSLADQLSVAIENADLHEEKKQQAVTDGLTGLANRRHFDETLEKEFERAKRYSEPLSLVLVDLDWLKTINDNFGHSAGDEAIRVIARILKQSSRSVDLPARYGGEEFCLLLPNTDTEMAVNIAERLRNLIAQTPVANAGHISASIGVANFPIHARSPDELSKRADEALYQAKQGGRNRVCISSYKSLNEAGQDNQIGQSKETGQAN